MANQDYVVNNNLLDHYFNKFYSDSFQEISDKRGWTFSMDRVQQSQLEKFKMINLTELKTILDKVKMKNANAELLSVKLIRYPFLVKENSFDDRELKPKESVLNRLII